VGERERERSGATVIHMLLTIGMSKRNLPVDAMSGSYNPLPVDQSPTTGDLLIEILTFDDRRLPRNFSKLGTFSSDNFAGSRVHFAALCDRDQ
jgi:hypothetical protein